MRTLVTCACPFEGDDEDDKDKGDKNDEKEKADKNDSRAADDVTVDGLEAAKAAPREVGASGETRFITKAGKAKAVLLDINRYRALMDIVEEAETPYGPAPSAERSTAVRYVLWSSSTRAVRGADTAPSG